MATEVEPGAEASWEKLPESLMRVWSHMNIETSVLFSHGGVRVRPAGAGQGERSQQLAGLHFHCLAGQIRVSFLWAPCKVTSLLFLGRFLMTVSISLLVTGLFRFPISSWFSFGRLLSLRNHLFLLGCPICWHIVFHGTLCPFNSLVWQEKWTKYTVFFCLGVLK